MLPSVAILMRAKDEMPHLKRTLEALGRQTFTAFSLYGVDSGSTDGSREQLEKHCDNLTRIAPNDYAPGNVLNNAIDACDQNIIVLLNADAVPLSDTWLETLVAPIIAGELDAAFCRQQPRKDARFIVRADYERAYDPEKTKPDFFSAVACSFRRELWDQRKFRETGYAEDRDWAAACLQDGARIRLLRNCPVEHSHNYTLAELYQKRFRQAVTSSEPPDRARLLSGCLREIVRDILLAGAAFKFHTIPYNIAYRITIYRAVYNGLKTE